MSKTLKRIAWYINFVVTCVPMLLVLFPLAISSLVVIIFSPLLAFLGANGCKLQYKTPETWWEIYKRNLYILCTDCLPIVMWFKQ